MCEEEKGREASDRVSMHARTHVHTHTCTRTYNHQTHTRASVPPPSPSSSLHPSLSLQLPLIHTPQRKQNQPNQNKPATSRPNLQNKRTSILLAGRKHDPNSRAHNKAGKNSPSCVQYPQETPPRSGKDVKGENSVPLSPVSHKGYIQAKDVKVICCRVSMNSF